MSISYFLINVQLFNIFFLLFLFSLPLLVDLDMKTFHLPPSGRTISLVFFSFLPFKL